MKVLKKLRDPKSALFMACLVLFYSCNPGSETTSIEPSLTKEYFNYVLENSNLNNGTSVKQVHEISGKTFDVIQALHPNKSDYSYSDESITTTIYSQDQEVTLHILPLTDIEVLNKAHVYFETNGEIKNDFIEVTIDNNEDGYLASWSTVYSVERSECTDSIVSCDCQEGAQDIANIGGVIASAGLFGCFVCAFVGGAIAAVAAVGSLACPDEHDTNQ